MQHNIKPDLNAPAATPALALRCFSLLYSRDFFTYFYNNIIANQVRSAPEASSLAASGVAERKNVVVAVHQMHPLAAYNGVIVPRT